MSSKGCGVVLCILLLSQVSGSRLPMQGPERLVDRQKYGKALHLASLMLPGRKLMQTYPSRRDPPTGAMPVNLQYNPFAQPQPYPQNGGSCTKPPC